ncbi:hypothetical protein DPMN_023005 [Dreissena polymorpha]|uniref:Peptidase M14 domain-containing protein n=1 Tax=Dreissena polymorpha TaxID=45954 RepID=A0A9D4R9I8_DREPO|nr:hypothetical protein DPMN_023005 [Dreissena polymorpha]
MSFRDSYLWSVSYFIPYHFAGASSVAVVFGFCYSASMLAFICLSINTIHGPSAIQTRMCCVAVQIQSFLLALQSAYPTKVKVTNIGTTYEGRNIYAVKVSENLSQPKAKSVWVEAGTHAREWIAIASALNLIDKLLTASRTESSTMLRAYDWNIVPVHNPDGYAYSHSNSRLHRKNRQVESRPCYFSNYGIDLNRNWDADFGKAGTTTQCQGDTYPGMSAFAARETTALRNAVLGDMPNVEAFFSVHCYSELMLLPHGFNNTKPADYAHLFSVAEHMMRWLETVRGTYYLSGTPPEILYSASGGAYDYFKLQGVKYAYTYELSPSSSTGNGFVLSATHIPAVSEELFMSLWAFVDIVTK